MNASVRHAPAPIDQMTVTQLISSFSMAFARQIGTTLIHYSSPSGKASCFHTEMFLSGWCKTQGSRRCEKFAVTRLARRSKVPYSKRLALSKLMPSENGHTVYGLP